jgi:MFS transporter, DHA1 family, multidrug resistance protein
MPSPGSDSSPGPGRIEFVLLISAIMMLVAFAIDSMLPALPQIGSALGVTAANDRPLVITAFLVGFSVSLLFIGSISDRYGRRGLMIASLVGFVIASLAASQAQSFSMLLVARACQGMAAAGSQVLVRSVVRDRFEGRDMAQVMSLASMLFMAGPILAPSMGQAVIAFASWRWIFGALALLGLAVLIWVTLRLPETLAPKDRRAIDRATLSASARLVLGDRLSVGYTLAMTMASSALFGFLMSVQQIFETTFNRADFLPAGFAIMAIGMAGASLLNAAIVKRYGMRRIGHAALFFFTGVAAIHLLLSWSGHETLASFIGLQMVMMIGFSLMGGNFGAMAMERMGPVAGTASSLQGFASNIISTIAGTLIGQSFNGTTVPMYTAYFVGGLIALCIIYVTEGGQFFVARNAPAFQE